MDPYDILGLRPEASEQEIELAYRGRRSQYHPDKYHGSDDQTLRWATSKMQEVNTAYAALTTGTPQPPSNDKDQSAPDKSDGPGNPEVAEVHQRSVMTLLSYLSHTVQFAMQTRAIYFTPNIPTEKLHNALHTYATAVLGQEVIVLFDETFWGSAKEGLVITNDHIYLSPKLSATRHIELNSIHSLSCDGRQLIVNGLAMVKFSHEEFQPAMALMTHIDEYLKHRRLVLAPATEEVPVPQAVTQRISSFLAEFVKPRFFDEASAEARKKQRTVGYWLGHEVDGKLTELVRFKLNLRPDEALLSLSSLAINGKDYFFCVTNCGVHSLSSGRSHVFIGHGSLKVTLVSELIQESVFVGIQLQSGERILVSIKNVAIRPYAWELFTGLIDVLNGREAPTLDAGGGESQASDERTIFEIAKERILDLCELVAPIEQELGRNLIDRHRAEQYFGVLREALNNSETQRFALEELGQIALLSQGVLNCASNSTQEFPGQLLVAREDDSQLVDELKTLLRFMIQARYETSSATRTTEFFKR